MADSFARKFGVRLLSALLLLPAFLLSAWLGAWVFFAVVLLVSLFLLREFSGLAARREASRPGDSGALWKDLLFPQVLLLGAFQLGGILLAAPLFGFLLIAIFVRRILSADIQGAWEELGIRILGLVYLAWLPGHWILLRNLAGEHSLPDSAAFHWLLYGAGIVWMGDTGAYLVGSWIGRHPLGLGISPRKTREGLVGGLLFSLVFAAALRALWLPFLGLAEALLAAFLLYLAGFFGDLFESLLKRAVASKDSADLIPGHGGMMDRLDSLLFALPVFYWILLLRIVRG